MSEQRIRTIDGKERGLDDAVIDKFASGLRGQLLRRGDPGYDAARKVWNGMVDGFPRFWLMLGDVQRALAFRLARFLTSRSH